MRSTGKAGRECDGPTIIDRTDCQTGEADLTKKLVVRPQPELLARHVGKRSDVCPSRSTDDGIHTARRLKEPLDRCWIRDVHSKVARTVPDPDYFVPR